MTRRFLPLSTFAMACLAWAGGAAVAQETFDEPPPFPLPGNWNPTIFIDRWAYGGNFARPTLAGVACVPANPMNAIAQAGDREGAYTNAGAMTVEAYALLDTIAANAVDDSNTGFWVHLCPAAGTTQRTTVGLAARVQLNAVPAPAAGYLAVLSCQPGGATVWFRLCKDMNADLDSFPIDNIIDAGDTLVGPINVGTNAYNYWLTLSVATDAGGNAVLTATAQSYLDGIAFGALYTATYTDAAPLAPGFTGVVAYAPQGNKVFWDDSVGFPASGYWNGGNGQNPIPPESTALDARLEVEGQPGAALDPLEALLRGEAEFGCDGVAGAPEASALDSPR